MGNVRETHRKHILNVSVRIGERESTHFRKLHKDPCNSDLFVSEAGGFSVFSTFPPKHGRPGSFAKFIRAELSIPMRGPFADYVSYARTGRQLCQFTAGVTKSLAQYAWKLSRFCITVVHSSRVFRLQIQHYKCRGGRAGKSRPERFEPSGFCCASTKLRRRCRSCVKSAI